MAARILALDTSTDACSVALQTDGMTYARFDIAPRKHTQLLLPMVESVLLEARISVAELDAIAFGRGPGSFAGIRIATGAAQGLALANETPMIGVSTLEAMALAQFLRDPESQRVVSVLDARMDEVYWGVFERRVESSEISAVVPVTEEQVSAPGSLLIPAQLLDFDVVGSGLKYLEQMPASLTGSIRSRDADCYPDAQIMLSIAQQQLAQGNTLSVEQALPVYLREGSWKKRGEQ